MTTRKIPIDITVAGMRLHGELTAEGENFETLAEAAHHLHHAAVYNLDFVQAVFAGLTPEPEPEPGPVQDLHIFVLDPVSTPIPNVIVTSEGHEPRSTSGDGHCHFPVTGSALYDFAKDGWNPTTRDLPPGEHRVHLTRASVPAGKGIVKLQARGFVDDGGPFLGKIFTDMSALRLFEHERARHDQNCREMVVNGANSARILGMVGWPGREINPRRSDYLDLVRACITARYDMGLRTEFTVFADCNVLNMGMNERISHARKTFRGLRGLEHMLLFNEGSNEPGVSNYNGPWTLDQLIEIGRIAKEELPGVLYACGAPYEPPDGGTTWDDASYITLGRGADLVTPHYDRDIDKHDSVWRPIRQPIEGTNYGFACNNNEPIGPRSSVASETNPGRLRAAATFTWVARNAGYCYHPDAGVGVSSDAPIASQEGANVVFDGANYLPADAVQFQFHNWHWTSNPFETLDGCLSDVLHMDSTRGTLRTISGTHADGRFHTHVLYVSVGARLRARRAMEFKSYLGGPRGPYQAIGEHRLAANETIEIPPCTDAILVGRFV